MFTPQVFQVYASKRTVLTALVLREFLFLLEEKILSLLHHLDL
ncbi:hypothetical protein [Zooshikella ganghwensis]|nr:hypothetical protein [Zooshikella ganghwensis]